MIEFQRWAGLTPDGIVGPYTIEALDSVVGGPPHVSEEPSEVESTEDEKPSTVRGEGQTRVGKYYIANPVIPSELTFYKIFSEKELDWIDEIFHIPEIIRLLTAYKDFKDLPIVRIHKVSKEIYGSTKGAYQISTGADIVINEIQRTEKELKGTLIHEIYHFVEDHIITVEDKIPLDMPTPAKLQFALVHPEKINFNKYAFGWFVHPRASPETGKRGILNLELESIYSPLPITGVSIYPEREIDSETNEPSNPLIYQGLEELWGIGKNKAYEPPVMPQSGHTVSPEEDMAESMKLYLTSEETRQDLRNKHPLRFKLLELYFGRLERLRGPLRK